MFQEIENKVLWFNFLIFLLAYQIKNLKHGPAVNVAIEDRINFLTIDEENISLRNPLKLKKIVERADESGQKLLVGPETVVFDKYGSMYILSEDAMLVKLTDFDEDEKDPDLISAKATIVADLGIGRPLGGKFADDGSLYVADAILGLTRVQFMSHITKPIEAVVTLVANRVTSDRSQILYADDVDIGPKSGHVYFSDASAIEPERIGTKHWDTLQASIDHFMKGEKSGRLLRYNPKTNIVDVLAENLNFSNGIAVDKDENYVIVAETFSGRVLKYHLQGIKAGEIEIIIPTLPSVPDGADCSTQTGLCYVAIPSGPLGIVKMINAMPPKLEKYLRTLILTLPKSIQPKVVAYGGVVEFNPGNETVKPYITRIFQDPTGEMIEMITGVTLHEGKLYLGSLKNKYIGVYEM